MTDFVFELFHEFIDLCRRSDREKEREGRIIVKVSRLIGTDELDLGKKHSRAYTSERAKERENER